MLFWAVSGAFLVCHAATLRIGAGIGALVPWSAQTGVCGQAWCGRLEWGGWRHSWEYWWSAAGLAADYAWIQKPGYALETGIFISYAWFQAPDSLAREINRLYGAKLLYPVRFRQHADFGPRVAARLWGWRVQAGWPVGQLMDRRPARRAQWLMGYEWFWNMRS